MTAQATAPMPPVDRRVTWSTALDAAGTAFCAVWLAALLAFPLYKGSVIGYVPVLVGLLLAAVLARPVALSRARTALTRPGEAGFLALLLAGALVVRLAAVATMPLEPLIDDRQLHRYAVGMLNGEGYGQPGLRAFFPPGMSLTLTAWYWVTMPTPLAGKILQAVIGTVLVWATYYYAKACLSEEGARAAAIVTACFPTLVLYSATLGHEVLLGLVLVAAAILANTMAADSARWPRALVLGLLLGFGTLVKPICLLVPAVLAASWRLAGVSWTRIAGFVVVSGIALVLVVAPWTYRNYRVFGTFVPVSTNGGVTLYSASHDDATGLAVKVRPLPGETDEVSRDRVRMRAALAWIRHHPVRTAQLAWNKAVYVWGTSTSIMSVVSADRLEPRTEAGIMAVINVAWAALAGLASVATFVRRPWSRRPFLPATAILGYVFVLHLFWEAISRHHVPVLAFLVVLACSLIDAPNGTLPASAPAARAAASPGGR